MTIHDSGLVGTRPHHKPMFWFAPELQGAHGTADKRSKSLFMKMQKQLIDWWG